MACFNSPFQLEMFSEGLCLLTVPYYEHLQQHKLANTVQLGRSDQDDVQLMTGKVGVPSAWMFGWFWTRCSLLMWHCLGGIIVYPHSPILPAAGSRAGCCCPGKESSSQQYDPPGGPSPSPHTPRTGPRQRQRGPRCGPS